MRQTVKRDKHNEIVRQRARKSAIYRKTFERTLHQIDLALLVREMREDEGLTQAELAKKVGTTQSALKLHAEKKPNFDREVALV